MVGILITGHGKISSGIYESLKMIFGVNENIKFLDFLQSDTSENLKEKITQEVNKLLQSNDEVICLTDIKGGTPFKLCSELSLNNDKIAVISGINLPMLISVAAEMKNINLKDAIDIALEDGKNEISLFKLVKKQQIDTFEDGI